MLRQSDCAEEPDCQEGNAFLHVCLQMLLGVPFGDQMVGAVGTPMPHESNEVLERHDLLAKKSHPDSLNSVKTGWNSF